jgi:hypothetical protein
MIFYIYNNDVCIKTIRMYIASRVAWCRFWQRHTRYRCISPLTSTAGHRQPACYLATLGSHLGLGGLFGSHLGLISVSLGLTLVIKTVFFGLVWVQAEIV